MGEMIFMWAVAAMVAAIVLGVLLIWIINDGRQNEDEKRRMLARRFCVKCGYNVHASKGRCPECGEPIDGSEEI